MLSEWKRTRSLPQSEEVGSMNVRYSCSLYFEALHVISIGNAQVMCILY